MSDTNGRLRGSKFYKAKGLRTLIVRTPNETKIRLRLLAVTMGMAVHEVVQLILDDFMENGDKYKELEKNIPAGDRTEITVFVTPKSRQDLKIEGVKSECTMKDLAGNIVHRYLASRTKIKLGGS